MFLLFLFVHLFPFTYLFSSSIPCYVYPCVVVLSICLSFTLILTSIHSSCPFFLSLLPIHPSWPFNWSIPFLVTCVLASFSLLPSCVICVLMLLFSPFAHPFALYPCFCLFLLSIHLFPLLIRYLCPCVAFPFTLYLNPSLYSLPAFASFVSLLASVQCLYQWLAVRASPLCHAAAQLAGPWVRGQGQ